MVKMSAIKGSYLYCFVICILVFIKTTLCHSEVNDDLILKLIDKVHDMQGKINELEKNNRDLKQSISVLIGSTARFQLQIEDLTNSVLKCEENKEVESTGSTQTNSKEDESEMPDPLQKHHRSELGNTSQSEKQHTSDIRHSQDGENKSEHTDCKRADERIGKRQTTDNIAFSAYLDHVIRSLGKDQPVVYNQILLNDGGSYSEHTGIFRVPVAGVYLLSWSVTARKLSGEHAYDVWVKLVVNGVHQTGAVAESRDDGDDNQGSNSVVLRLNQDDEVWTSHYSSYPDIYGDDNERTTSFMGVLLYVDQ